MWLVLKIIKLVSLNGVTIKLFVLVLIYYINSGTPDIVRCYGKNEKKVYWNKYIWNSSIK